MKIISVGPAYPYRGGLASFNDRLTQQFSAEGHDIEIFTFRLQYPKFLFPGKTQYTEGPPPDNIKITRKINSINPINWITTGLNIKREKPDILLIRFWLPFMGPCFGTIARIAKSNMHTSVICIFDNVIPHEKRTGDKAMTMYFTKSIDGAIVMSQTVFDELNAFNKKIPVKLSPHPLFDNYGLPVGRKKALAELKLDDENSYLLFFGFIRAYKGLDLLIEAFSDKRLRNRKLKLIIAGEFYEDKTPYEDQIAFYFEKPMLVTDVGGLREIVPDGKCGYVVKPEPEFIAEALLDFFDNDRKELFTAGVKREKEKFSWEKMTQAIVEVYKLTLSLIR